MDLARLDLWLLRHLGQRFLFARSPLSTKQRVRWVCAQVGTQKLDILEAGCGSGIFSFLLANLGHRVTAVDREPWITKCVRRYQAIGETLPGHIQFVAHDLRALDELPLADGFDCVVCTEVIEHIKNDEKLIVDLARCLRKGGRLVLTTPNKFYPPLFGDRLSEVEDGGHVRKGYDGSDLMKLCEPCGLEIVSTDYVSGYFTQKLINLERRIARKLGGLMAMALVYPFRLLSQCDRWVPIEPLCIAVVARKR